MNGSSPGASRPKRCASPDQAIQQVVEVVIPSRCRRHRHAQAIYGTAWRMRLGQAPAPLGGNGEDVKPPWRISAALRLSRMAPRPCARGAHGDDPTHRARPELGEVGDDARAGGAKGGRRRGSSLDVELARSMESEGRVATEVFLAVSGSRRLQGGQHLGGEGLVDLVEIEVLSFSCARSSMREMAMVGAISSPSPSRNCWPRSASR